MFKSLEFYISYKFISYRILRTFFIVLAISIGVAVQIFVAIIIDSTQANLLKRTLGYSSHILIKPYDDEKINDKIKNPEIILNQIKDNYPLENFKKIIYTVEGGVLAYNFINKDDLNVRLIGFKDVYGKDIYGIEENLLKGNFSLLKNREAIIGYNIYEKLNLEIDNLISIKNNLGDYKSFKIVGIFKSGNQSLDNTIFIKIEEAQDFLGFKRNEYSSILFQINNVFESDKIKKIISNNFNFPYELTEWKESNKQLLNGLSAQSQSSFFIQFFILISIAISILSILNMKVVEKYKEIGILKALGMNNNKISKIFIFMSLLIGFLGVLLGTLFAFLLLNIFINLTKSPEGIPLFNLVIRTNFLIATILFNLFAVIFAGYISSRKAIKYEPAKIIVGA
ncbi:MAG: permease [Candidatus Parcubacteria bacterium]|nr:MAG: permease [Candidatus Parcubacteria bacterium]